MSTETASRRRWVILAVGLLAQMATCVFLYGLAVLVPLMRAKGQLDPHGLSLSGAGTIVAAPSIGLLIMLIIWGAAADRYGERVVITIGMTIAAVALLAAAASHGVVALCLSLVVAGAGAASVNAASGRMVLGWFSVKERGLAMGIRQTAQPLGVGVAALTLPAAGRHWGIHHALLIPAGLCAVFAVLVLLIAQDPPRPARSAAEPSPSPYRQPVLWRIHAASAALVVPQFAVSGFTLAYLVTERSWSPIDAGRLVFAMQLAGAAGRIGAGVWSDRVGSRLRPMRILAVASALLMVAIALCDLADSWVVIAAFTLAAVVTVADNGLAFTSVAEIAGPRWAGRALGVQNTGQNISAALTPPLLGWAIGSHGYALGFFLAAVFPALAIGVVPVRLAEAQNKPRDEVRNEGPSVPAA